MTRTSTLSAARLLLVVTVTAGLLACLTTTSQAAAYPQGERSTEMVSLAGANWEIVDDDLFSFLTLSVHDWRGTEEAPGLTRFAPSMDIFYGRNVTDRDLGVHTEVNYVALGPIPDGGFEFDMSMRGASARFDTVLTSGTVCRYTLNGPPDGLVAADDEPAEEPEQPEDDCSPLPDIPVRVDLEWRPHGPTYRDGWRFRAGGDRWSWAFAQQLITVRDATVVGNVVPLGAVPDEVDLFDRPADHGVVLRGKAWEHRHAGR